ncbi:hypothetical protein CK203_034702 [Vitis vinifera]|uniref:Uncharacterized protein n=1 Tax=Vitis vinifera TaxID=29760 RepID=A0A438HWB0_VITVI|nr:hypothetical protein CK203_034702 [Vitis vinifera]
MKSLGPTLGKASDLRPWRFTSLSLASFWEVKDHLEWQMLGERHKPLQDASEKKQVTGTPFLYEESEPSDLKLQETLFFVINFVDYSLNQGAPAGHKSAETPSGHESPTYILHLDEQDLPSILSGGNELYTKEKCSFSKEKVSFHGHHIKDGKLMMEPFKSGICLQRHHLLESDFIVKIDTVSTSYFQTQKKQSPKKVRWQDFLVEFNYTLEYKPESVNHLVDATLGYKLENVNHVVDVISYKAKLTTIPSQPQGELVNL